MGWMAPVSGVGAHRVRRAGRVRGGAGPAPDQLRRLRCAGPVEAASAVFVGRIFDAAGRPMTPTFAYSKAKRIYRYYVSQSGGPPIPQGATPLLRRFSGPLREGLVAGALARVMAKGVSANDLPIAAKDCVAYAWRSRHACGAGAPGLKARLIGREPHDGTLV